MDGERIAIHRLGQEAVEHGAVVSVIVEAVDQRVVETRLLGLGAPHDALMEVGDPQPVVAGVELKQQLVQRLAEVVHAAGLCGVEDGPRGGLPLGIAHRHIEIAFRDFEAIAGIAIHAHGPEMDQMGIQVEFDQRHQEVVGGVDVVVDGVAFGGAVAHGIGRGALLGEVDHCIRVHLRQQAAQPIVVLGDVDVAERN